MAKQTAGEIGAGSDGERPSIAPSWLRRLCPWCSRKHSARTYATVPVIALILPLLAFSLFVILHLNDRERDADRKDLASTARALSAAMDLKMKMAVSALEVLAGGHAIAEGDLEHFYAEAQRVAALHHGWVLLADREGMQVFTTRDPLGTPTRPLRSTQIVKTVAETGVTQISGAFVGFAEPQVSAYLPVKLSGEIPYVLLISFNMGELSQALLDQQLPESWTVQVMDRGHHIIARNAAMDPSAELDQWSPPGDAAAGDTFTALDAHGEPALAALARSSFTGWSLVVMVPKSEIYAPLYQSLRHIGVAAAVLLLVGSATVVFVGRSIAGPMRALAAAALALGRGERLPPMAARIIEVDDVMTALIAAGAHLAEEARERGAAEAALRRSEQRFRDIAETSGDWIWETDREHRFTYFSKNGPAAFSLNPQELLGRARWEFNSDAEGGSWAPHRADLDARRPFRGLRYSFTSDGGNRIHYCVGGKPIFDDKGEFLGYRGTATNETAIVEARGRAERAENLLQDAIDSLSAGVLIYDQDDRLIMANEAWRQSYRKSLGVPAIGRTFEEVVREDLAAGRYTDAIGREREWLAKRIEHHRSGTGSLQQQIGGDRWFLVTDRRMRNGGIAGLRVDITDLKAAQAALRASEERLDRAQEIAKIGSWELDVASKQYIWSKEMFRIRGFAEDAPQPTMGSLVRTIHADDFPKVHEWLKELRNGGEPSAVEFRVRRPDGEERVISSEGRCIRDQNGAVTRVTGTAQDVTEARRTEAAREELEHQLRHSQKLEALGTLAGGIAHDLNNTLVPVVAMTKLAMKRAGGDKQMLQCLGMIHDAGNRARDLVKRVLAFSRKDRAERQEFDIANVVCEALGMLRATVPTTISLVSDIRPVPNFVGDSTQIHQVVINLVTNAMQAIGPEPGTVSVSLNTVKDPARRRPTTIRLMVSDSGCGMDEATARRIFEPFFTTKGVGEGTGLGLSVVHGIVTNHGGAIRVESRPGQGARFIIDLPTVAEQELSLPAKIPA
ncbi:MAG TPA: ATP-binding protein [Stellaceae bacterium]|nr:ATP-binding protein [Stellaceae bacterium]